MCPYLLCGNLVVVLVASGATLGPSHTRKQSANTTASATPSALRVDAACSRCSANSRSVSSNRASSA